MSEAVVLLRVFEMADGIDLIMNKETALLPCPFCGDSAKIEYHEYSDYAWGNPNAPEEWVNPNAPEEWPLYFGLRCANKDCLSHGLIYMRQCWPNNPEIIRARNSCSTNWQPIETAPKDGQTILLSDGQKVLTGAWADEPGAWKVCPFNHDCDEPYWGGGWTYAGGPTHWMPLPALPNLYR